MNILAILAIVAGAISLWQPRHFRLAVGIYLLIVGIVGLGIIHL